MSTRPFNVQIRGDILQSNPRFDFRGVVDVHKEGADALAEKYGVSFALFVT